MTNASMFPPAAPQPPGPPTVPTQAVKGGAGMAVAALVLGICGIIPVLGMLLGLAGLILGIVVLAMKKKGTGMAIGGIVASVVCSTIGQVVLMSLLILPALYHARGLAKRAVSMANLNGIGKAIAMYENDPDNAAPAPSFEELVDSGLIGRESLTYPGANTGRKYDYFYLPDTAGDYDPKRIVACELKGDYTEDGRNVLYADGAVKWLATPDFEAALADPVNAEFAAALKQAEGP